jgi:DNA-binding XRE family transcriptional regulator
VYRQGRSSDLTMTCMPENLTQLMIREFTEPVASQGKRGDQVKVRYPDHTVVDSRRLRQLRRERGFSQLALAIRAGVGLTTLARLERETRPRSRNYTIARLAIALDAPLNSLRDPSDPRYASKAERESVTRLKSI